jgi:hypothetical protein
MYTVSKIVVAGVFAAFTIAPALAGPDGVNNIADILHPNIHQNVTDGNNANPNGKSPAGGANLHGIGNTPGQNDDVSPSDGEPGFADQLGTVHGGIALVNNNVPD